MIKHVKMTDSNKDKYHWFDGSVVDVDSVHKYDRDLLFGKRNYIDTENSFKTDRGMVLASQFLGTFVPLNVFNELKTDALDDINETDQWLTSSYNLDEEQYIGYVFTSGEDFFLNQCRFIPRLGPNGKAGLLSPSPKSIVIEGTVDGKTWDAISEEIVLNPQSFLEVTDIDFGDVVDIPMVGFRLVIKSWYPGSEEEMFTGLYKLEFICTPATKVRLPKKDFTNKKYFSCIDKYSANNDQDITEEPEESVDITEEVSNITIEPESDSTIYGSVSINSIRDDTGTIVFSDNNSYIAPVSSTKFDVLETNINSINDDICAINCKFGEYSETVTVRLDNLETKVSQVNDLITTCSIKANEEYNYTHYTLSSKLDKNINELNTLKNTINVGFSDTEVILISDNSSSGIFMNSQFKKKIVILPINTEYKKIRLHNVVYGTEFLIDNTHLTSTFELEVDQWHIADPSDSTLYSSIVMEPDSYPYRLTASTSFIFVNVIDK